MPSQFRFGRSEPPSSSPKLDNSSVVTNDAEPNVSIPVVAPQMAELEARTPDPMSESPDELSTTSGLHDVVKSTEFWFNYELSLLEKYAVTSAMQWAQAGIPRQDAPLGGELPIETTLKARASEIFQGWIARMKRKVQDSIQAASADAGSRIVQFRYAIAQIERTAVEIRTTEEKLFDREEGLRNQQKTFASPALLNRWIYGVILLGVAIVDWIANVPIFNELLPQEPGSRLIWRKLVADTAQLGAVGGIHRLFDRILFQPDVTVFALGVVIFLTVLAHFGGEALRRWVVFRPNDEPLLAHSFSAQRRQAMLPIIVSVIGILFAIGFLYFSRTKLVQATGNGRANAEAVVRGLQSEKANVRAGREDLSQLPTIEQSLESASLTLKDWEERESFARDISMMNVPILMLNFVLAFTALTASYCAASPKVVEGRLIDPVIPELKATLASHRLEMVNHRQLLRALDGDIQTSIARAQYLAGTHPLSDAEAKAGRLSAVVPLFRAENARARGVDPESIVAFRQPASLTLPVVPDEPFQLPIELVAWDEEFKSLRRALGDSVASEPQPIGIAA
jgi:hypothetical protein